MSNPKKETITTVSGLCAWAFARGVDGIGHAYYEEIFTFPTIQEAKTFKKLAATVANAKAKWNPGSKKVIVVIKPEDA